MSERAAPEPLRVVISGERLREEPYRIFFPLALALGAAGVAPWLLFGAGLTSRWLASFHALTQMQAFMLAFAAGFLLTAVPKRTRSAPASWIEIALVALLLPGVAAAAFLDQLVASQAAYAAALVVIAQFAVRRFFGRASGRRPPASFAAAPVGLAAGVAGAGLLIASTLKGAPAWVLPLGRALVLDGVFLCLVLGVGAFFFALALHGKAAADAPASAEGRRAMAWHALAALGIVASLAVEVLGAPRLGLALRALRGPERRAIPAPSSPSPCSRPRALSAPRRAPGRTGASSA